jgi:hypothetical protein
MRIGIFLFAGRWACPIEAPPHRPGNEPQIGCELPNLGMSPIF